MTDTKVFKFVFTANVQSVSLALKFPCVVSVMWKRGILLLMLGEKTAEVK
jgi:hypothetical protein